MLLWSREDRIEFADASPAGTLSGTLINVVNQKLKTTRVADVCPFEPGDTAWAQKGDCAVVFVVIARNVQIGTTVCREHKL